jgi:tetratricopeptide (TPR) repeat protein
MMKLLVYCQLAVISTLLLSGIAYGKNLAEGCEFEHSVTAQSLLSSDPLFTMASTSNAIFIHNLNSQLRHLKNKLKQRPHDVHSHRAMAHNLWQKGLIYSDMALIEQAAKHVDTIVSFAGNLAQTYLLRAKINMSLHRFDAARADLNQRQQGPEAKVLLQQLNWLDGTGELTDSNTVLKATDSTASWAGLASYLLAQQQPQRANIALNHAINNIRDSHPIVLISLHLLKSQWATATNKPALALAHLKSAVARLPHHVGALEGLAAAYQDLGNNQSAISCLQKARQQSADPHLSGLLAQAYDNNGRKQDAVLMRQNAIDGYTQMLARFPHAYAGEAAHYFLLQSEVSPQTGPTNQQLLNAAGQWAKFDANNRTQPHRWLMVAQIFKRLGDTGQINNAVNKVLNNRMSTALQRHQAQRLFIK